MHPVEDAPSRSQTDVQCRAGNRLLHRDAKLAVQRGPLGCTPSRKVSGLARRVGTHHARGLGNVQLDGNGRIAMFEFEESDGKVVVCCEKHYELVTPDQVTDDDLKSYRRRV